MSRCALTDDEELQLKKYVEQSKLLYLSTPFSRAAANHLNNLDVEWYKIGSGECNNYPLIRHVASFNKPVILSTGMNDIGSISPSVEIMREQGIPFALLHCTSLYPTPYDKVRLGAIMELKEAFPDAILGLSDHSLGNYTCFGAVTLGCSIVEKHFTSNMNWPGPDISISIDPDGLADLIVGCDAVYKARDGSKEILTAEQATIDFAYACVVSLTDIAAGEKFDESNVWVKRPGTGEIKAKNFEDVLGSVANKAIPKNSQICWADIK
jgi:N-acetylneuraminate synthase